MRFESFDVWREVKRDLTTEELELRSQVGKVMADLGFEVRHDLPVPRVGNRDLPTGVRGAFDYDNRVVIIKPVTNYLKTKYGLQVVKGTLSHELTHSFQDPTEMAVSPSHVDGMDEYWNCRVEREARVVQCIVHTGAPVWIFRKLGLPAMANLAGFISGLWYTVFAVPQIIAVLTAKVFK